MLCPRLQLPVEMLPQPDEVTCGPTCLHALYRYWGRQEPLSDVIERTGKLDIGERLLRQRAAKPHDRRVQEVTPGYVEFLKLGGRLRLTDLSRYLLRGFLRRRLPVITGLSSTYLYRTMREYGPQDLPDDVRGTPGGHFVVLAGYDRPARTVLVADPYGPARGYWLKIDRAVGAVLLGVLTHDANLLIIHPPRAQRR